MGHQRGEQRPGLGAADRDHSPVAPHHDRTKDQDSHTHPQDMRLTNHNRYQTNGVAAGGGHQDAAIRTKITSGSTG
ncbi:hypothetical protein Aglo01_43780 [Actinokineospora globicatena]|nr:hypothetical protein Aglo01_43780 [Actinokineospora globicatena]GLW85693.1 hypothetical protein Aglo02_33330 [Actinokineospora globicatena]